MKRVLSAAMALILCLSLIPVAHASYTNPFDKQDNQEVPYSGGLYFGFSESETLNSSVKPQISVSTIEYESDNIPSGWIEVSVSVTGAANQWSASGLYIGYDTRLTLRMEDTYEPYVELGAAAKKLMTSIGVVQSGIIYAVTASDSDKGGEGEMYTFQFKLPSNAKAGDFYPIGIFCRPERGRPAHAVLRVLQGHHERRHPDLRIQSRPGHHEPAGELHRGCGRYRVLLRIRHQRKLLSVAVPHEFDRQLESGFGF